MSFKGWKVAWKISYVGQYEPLKSPTDSSIVRNTSHSKWDNNNVPNKNAHNQTHLYSIWNLKGIEILKTYILQQKRFFDI